MVLGVPIFKHIRVSFFVGDETGNNEELHSIMSDWQVIPWALLMMCRLPVKNFS